MFGKGAQTILASPETGRWVNFTARGLAVTGVSDMSMRNKIPMKLGLVILCLCILGLATHLVPHEMGVSTLGMLGMLGAAYLPGAGLRCRCASW